MRNKTGVITLGIVITVLSLFYLSFTLVSRSVENKANEYARGADGKIDYSKKRAYLDSIYNTVVYDLGFAKYTYKEVKENELNLGLDLQGGMHVVLEVSPVEILNGLSGNSDDADYLKALKLAQERQAGSNKPFATLFFEAFAEIAPNRKLAEVFANSSNKGRIDFNSSDAEVRRVIEYEIENAINRAEKIVTTRIDKFGVTSPNIQRIQGTGRIQLELPGVDNPERVRKLLQGVAKLEFIEVWETQEVAPYLEKVNDFLVKRQKAQSKIDNVSTDTAKVVVKDELFDDTQITRQDSAQTKQDTTELAEVSDIYKLLRARDALIYETQDTAKINSILNDPAVRNLLPQNMRFLWAVKPFTSDDGKQYVQLFPVKKMKGAKAQVGGEEIVDARQSFDQMGRAEVQMQMNVEGAKRWKKMTANNIGKKIAIVLDDYVYSAPVVQAEIPNGSSSISGNFTVEEAQDLANVLKAGKLPAPTRIVEEAVVGPSLGIEAQNQGLISIVCGLILVVIFMIMYYGKGGLIANAALLFNMFFIFGILAQLHAALTLPGIAGIVLTMGMSVDANVLIFERIREELKKGSALTNAITTGYERAFWTIFDSNITTLLVGFFLYSFGSGPVQGFAVTLMVGIACSFFTAVYITRVIVEYILSKKADASAINFETALSRNALSDFKIKFIPNRKIAYGISVSVIIIGMGLIAIQGLNLGVDFLGGRSYVVEFGKPIVPSEMKVALDKFLGDNASVEVKSFGSEYKVKITTNYLVNDESDAADEKVLQTLIKGITEFTGAQYVENASSVTGTEFTIPSTAKVGATIADDIAESARWSVLLSLLAIFFYIWMRFRQWRFGLGAVVALLHDALMLLAMFAITRAIGISFEIDQVFVAAMLTIIGYSINDTVVVFDRVRENMNVSKLPLSQTIDNAINGTLSRTLMTSFTTLIVVVTLLIFGGEILRGFSYALLVGILWGTYSSVFIATPLVYDTIQLAQSQKQVPQAA
ncbi:MAG: protein translocase subunit SecDF [Cytophagales bacterium]|nr:protein translocase subunit SecDF [Cytophagales bacterium]MDW8384174.1 protein translocase subunit SecDF [Flammeovirgaceae bacterium]